MGTENQQQEENSQEKVEIPQAQWEEMQAKSAALETRLRDEQLEKARLEERIKTSMQPPTPEQKVHTEMELQEMVTSGHITQAQMTMEIERRKDAVRAEEMRAEVKQQLGANDTIKVLQKEMDSYVEIHPDVKVDGSAERAMVQAEIKHLMDLGYEYDLRTEVTALRSCFGPPEKVAETTSQRRERHQGTSGGGAGGAGETSKSGWQSDLTPGQSSAYQMQLDKGIYSGVDDPMFKRVCERARAQNRKSA